MKTQSETFSKYANWENSLLYFEIFANPASHVQKQDVPGPYLGKILSSQEKLTKMSDLFLRKSSEFFLTIHGTKTCSLVCGEKVSEINLFNVNSRK